MSMVDKIQPDRGFSLTLHGGAIRVALAGFLAA